MKRTIQNLNGKITFSNDDPTKPSSNFPVSEHLAVMIETAVKNTNASININSTTGGKHSPRSFHQFGMALDINRINNRRIDDPSNASDVMRFQQAICQIADIAECFGPFINIRKKDSQAVQMPQMRILHLNHLHVSSQR